MRRRLTGLLAALLTTAAAHAQSPPANDDCAGALALPVATACAAPTVAATDYATATTAPGLADPTCADYDGGDLWYTVVVPANGIIMLETSEVAGGNVSNTGLAVYGGSCGSLALLACDDNGSGVGFSYVRLTGRTAGEVLYVRVWANYNSQGSFTLSATTDDALPTTTWTGAAGSDWFAAGNWSAGVPTAATNAYVPGGAAHYPNLSTAGLTATAHTLSIDKYADFTFSAGTLAVSGNLRCREPYARFIDSNAFPYLGGEVRLTGTAPQQLSGISELYDLRVAATGPVLLTSSVRLDHRLTLAGGVLNTGTALVELYNDNPYAGEFFSNARLVGETETSYVLGRIQTQRDVDNTTGPEDFSGLGFTLSTTSTTADAPGSVLLNRYTGPAQAGLNGRAGIRRHYVAVPFNDTNLDVTLDLHYFSHELNGLADNNLRAFSSPVAGGMGDPYLPTGPWTAEAGGARLAPAAPDSASTFRLAGLAHLSAWTLGAATATAPLPVELARFEVAATGPDALLSWATASEKNSRYFEAEASTDGRTFAPIGRVAGQGSSSRANAYTLRHADAAHAGAPVLYYRLHQVDQDGTGSYSPVRTLAVGAGVGRPSAFPNPFADNLTVWLPAAPAGPALLVLRDATGRERLRQTTVLPAAGAQAVALAGAGQLPAGIYLLTIGTAGHTAQLKVSRQ